MYKLCKTERSAERQRLIEEELLSLMLTKRYDEITVSELCDRMPMPRKAFYRYFDGKDDCLKALLDHTLLEYFEYEAQRRSGRERRALSAELELFFLFWIDNKRLLDALEKSDMLGMLVETSASSTRVNVNVRKFLPGEGELMRERIFQFSVCGLMFSMIGWYKAGFNSSTREMAEAAVRMLSKPLFPNLDSVGFV
jgi:AcrR family transcriptional regulator